MKRKIYLLVTFLLALAISIFSFVACDKGHVKAEIVSKSDTMVVIKVNETEGFSTLLDAMNYLKNEGELSFEVSGTMISSIEGKANPADWSSCWMVYISDADFACEDDERIDYDTLEYQGVTYFLAILGAEGLPVSSDGYYIWSYVTF